MKVTVEGNEIVIRVPMKSKPFQASTSGKNLTVVAETDRSTGANVDGKPLTVQVNAYTPNR